MFSSTSQGFREGRNGKSPCISALLYGSRDFNLLKGVYIGRDIMLYLVHGWPFKATASPALRWGHLFYTGISLYSQYLLTQGGMMVTLMILDELCQQLYFHARQTA